MGASPSAIQRAEVFRIETAVAVPAGPAGVTYRSRQALLVRVDDGHGLVGWGETYVRPGGFAAAVVAAEAALGADPRDASVLADRLDRVPDRYAASAVSIATDDLRARQLDVSVATLHGGRRRDWVGAYASSGGYREDRPIEESWPQEVRSALDDGLRACKIRIGRFPVGRELAVLSQVREMVGSEVDLMVDANGAYTVPQALTVGHELAALRFRWFEEPLIRRHFGLVYPGYELLGGLSVPLAAGEGLESRSAFAEFIRRCPVLLLQPDVSVCGGIRETLFAAELAALSGRVCVPHAWGGPIQRAATLQVLAALADTSEVAQACPPLLEFDRFENPLHSEIVEQPIKLRAGGVDIPAGPGLGVAIDTDAVRGLAGEAWSSSN